MRILIVLILQLALSACSASVNPLPTSEAEKISQAEQLVRYSLSDRLLSNLRLQMEDQLPSLLVAQDVPPQAAERILNDELPAVIAAEEQRLLDNLVPVYRRYYTAAEISQLLSFYQTDVARKSQKISGQIAAEVRPFVRVWNGHFEESLLERITARLAEEGVTIAP